MKIVGFEAEGGLRLGVVEGDQVIDLQAVDAKVPADLGAVLAANNGDLKPLSDMAKRAPAAARRPLKGLKIASRLNGTVMQSDNTDNMMFPVADMLVYVTQGMTLEPGDIIFTGTPSGVGHARKPNPIWMKQGDVCEIEIEGIGVLRNPIQDEA